MVSDLSAKRSAGANAVVAFGQSSCAPLPRSQVLSLLHSDCQASKRAINLLVLHCSDTRPSQHYTLEMLKRDHARRGFGQWPGYHLYIRRDGTLYYCRPASVMGCHVSGYNAHSIGICYEGGHRDDDGIIYVADPNGTVKKKQSPHRYEDDRTAEQLVVIDEVLRTLHNCYPDAKIVGHRDLCGGRKACPCTDQPVDEEYAYIMSL